MTLVKGVVLGTPFSTLVTMVSRGEGGLSSEAIEEFGKASDVRRTARLQQWNVLRTRGYDDTRLVSPDQQTGRTLWLKHASREPWELNF